MNTFKKHGLFWVLLGLFITSITIHWVTAWYSFVDEHVTENKPANLYAYFNEVIRQSAENWQSEFLQLVLQISLVAYLWFVGSPQSRSEEDRLEEKIDFLMSQINPIQAEQLQKELNRKYPKK